MTHMVDVKLQMAWNEWRAECDCGWTGSYWREPGSAIREARKHAPAIRWRMSENG